MKPLFLKVDLPEYRIDAEPDYRAIGKKVDAEIKKHFMGRTVVVRGIGSSEHAGKSVDELAEVIQNLGTDRYDPARPGDRYENLGGKHIDFFAFRRKVSPRTELFKDIAYGFYRSAIGVHGRPVRIDILIIYDATQVRAVVHQYQGRTGLKRDGYVFRDPANKPAAVLGILKIEE
jgi:hypothetical protein